LEQMESLVDQSNTEKATLQQKLRIADQMLDRRSLDLEVLGHDMLDMESSLLDMHLRAVLSEVSSEPQSAQMAKQPRSTEVLLVDESAAAGDVSGRSSQMEHGGMQHLLQQAVYSQHETNRLLQEIPETLLLELDVLRARDRGPVQSDAYDTYSPLRVSDGGSILQQGSGGLALPVAQGAGLVMEPTHVPEGKTQVHHEAVVELVEPLVSGSYTASRRRSGQPTLVHDAPGTGGDLVHAMDMKLQRCQDTRMELLECLAELGDAWSAESLAWMWVHSCGGELFDTQGWSDLADQLPIWHALVRRATELGTECRVTVDSHLIRNIREGLRMENLRKPHGQAVQLRSQMFDVMMCYHQWAEAEAALSMGSSPDTAWIFRDDGGSPPSVGASGCDPDVRSCPIPRSQSAGSGATGGFTFEVARDDRNGLCSVQSSSVRSGATDASREIMQALGVMSAGG
jgi:hypothetical protein